MNNAFAELEAEIIRFRDDRNWAQFHTLKNLMMSLNIEVSEMLELVQWKNDVEITEGLLDPETHEALADECADVFVHLLMICYEAGVDLEKATRSKLVKNALKYPIDQAYGSAAKYTQLDIDEGFSE